MISAMVWDSVGAVVPYLPDVLETKLVGVDADESPYGEDQNPEHVEAEHLPDAISEQLGSHIPCHQTTYRLRRDLPALLHEPEETVRGGYRAS